MTYAYDSLNRLLSASSSSGWAETYGYDGFGNLLSKTPTAGTPPSLSQAANPANNQIVGQSYDSNGNQVTAPGFFGSATFDVENRIVAAPGIQYAYDSQNKRVWSGTVDSSNNLNLQSVYFYGINGKRIGTYSLNVSYGAGQYTEIADPPANLITYFGSKRLDILEDQLGSNFTTALYPWGEDRTGQPNDQTKFATYTRDSATLLDYANNRYYSNAYGRFMTPDPYRGSGKPGDPQSWNEYAYTRGDPVNRKDPTGEDDEDGASDCVIGGLSWPMSFCEDFLGYGMSIGQAKVAAVQQTIIKSAAHVYPLFAPGTTQNQEQALDAGINSAWAHLLSNPQCASFLTGNPGGSIAQAWGQLAGVIDSTTYSFADLNDVGTAAQTTEPGNQVMINTKGAFFAQGTFGSSGPVFVQQPSANGPIQIGFSSVVTLDASILLHELGHETGVLGPDLNDAAQNGSNSAAIDSNCFTKNAQGLYQ